MGPLINQGHVDHAVDIVHRSVKQGAKLAAGGVGASGNGTSIGGPANREEFHPVAVDDGEGRRPALPAVSGHAP